MIEQKLERRPSAADMIDLRCCRLGNCTFLSLWKIILGSGRLGKYLTSLGYFCLYKLHLGTVGGRGGGG